MIFGGVFLTIILIRTVILYMVILFFIRIMGKAELSKMSPFQLIVSFMIAELAAIPIESPDVSMITGVTAIFTLLFLQVFISFLSIKSERIKNIFSGTPSIIIDNGEINLKEMKKLRITTNDLLEQLRIGGCPSISDVEYAVMESNGALSIIKKSETKPLTAKDLSIKKEKGSLPVILITDGTLYSGNLITSGWNETQLKKALSDSGILRYEDVFLAFCDENSKLHIFIQNEKSTHAKEIV